MFKINQSHIDPLPLFEIGPLQAILMRDEVKVPDQQLGEGEEQYAERLRQVYNACMSLHYIIVVSYVIANQREAPLERKSSN